MSALTKAKKIELVQDNCLSAMRETGALDSGGDQVYGIDIGCLLGCDNGFGSSIALQAMAKLIEAKQAWAGRDGKRVLFLPASSFYRDWLAARNAAAKREKSA